jgi:hypothetical protein
MMGTFIGWVQGGSMMAFGTHASFKSSSKGVLSFAFNDRACCYGDNSGSINVDLTISRTVASLVGPDRAQPIQIVALCTLDRLAVDGAERVLPSTRSLRSRSV